MVGERLRPSATGVHDDQHRARREIGGGGGDQRRRILARFGRGFEHDDTFVGESDGLSNSASSLVVTSPARSLSTGTSPVPACVRACAEHRGDGPLDKQFFVAEHEMQCRW